MTRQSHRIIRYTATTAPRYERSGKDDKHDDAAQSHQQRVENVEQEFMRHDETGIALDELDDTEDRSNQNKCTRDV